MRKKLTKSIIKTLCYAQVFSYPLTVSEIWKYLISDRIFERHELMEEIKNNRELFECVREYVVLSGGHNLIHERALRVQESKRKLAKALWISQLLSVIPGIRLIAISGSLSMYNAKPSDDIDLFFITAENMLWSVRLMVNIMLLVLGEKRKKGKRRAMDKICPNMFISEEMLRMKTRNLYVAHEVAQMKVLYSKENMYLRFLRENIWVLNFLPHAFSRQAVKEVIKPKKRKNPLLPILDKTLFLLQYYYMKNGITNEKIERNTAAFHPLKQGKIIMALYKLNLKAWENVSKNPHYIRYESQFHTVN